MLNLGLGVAADDEKSDAGEGGSEENEGEEELGAQAEIGWAMRQEVCDRAAGQEPVAELDKCHKAYRVGKWVGSGNGSEVPFAEYEESLVNGMVIM